MEQRYWEQFMKTGGICDYLGYKMEVYGHAKDRDEEHGKQRNANGEAVMIPLYPQEHDTA